MSVSGARSVIGSLSWECAPGIVVQGAVTGLVNVFIWKVSLCVAQSIDGSCWSNHGYPRTADVECASGVRRNQMGCIVPLGNIALRVVDCTIRP